MTAEKAAEMARAKELTQCQDEITRAIGDAAIHDRTVADSVAQVMDACDEAVIGTVLQDAINSAAWDGRFHGAPKKWAMSCEFERPARRFGYDPANLMIHRANINQFAEQWLAMRGQVVQA